MIGDGGREDGLEAGRDMKGLETSAVLGKRLLVGEAKETALRPTVREGVRGVLVSDLDRSLRVGVFGLCAMTVAVKDSRDFQRRGTCKSHVM